MTTHLAGINPDILSSFTSLSTDQKLALLWFIYEEVGKSVTPAAPDASTAGTAIAEGLFKQVQDLSYEEQLQIQRDLVEHKNTLISREYGAFSDTTKLLFWYLLAQGMDRTEIVPMPPNYPRDPQVQQCLQQIQQIPNFEQITVLRDLVADMGVDPNANPHDRNTGL